MDSCILAKQNSEDIKRNEKVLRVFYTLLSNLYGSKSLDCMDQNI